MTQQYDAVIIGGGHNGLTTAAYLARAGKKVLVLERRHVLGGAAVTEEVFPGFKFSVCSYVVSLLRPEIIRSSTCPVTASRSCRSTARFRRCRMGTTSGASTTTARLGARSRARIDFDASSTTTTSSPRAGVSTHPWPHWGTALSLIHI